MTQIYKIFYTYSTFAIFFASGKCHANNYLIIFVIFAKKYLEIEEIFV